VSSYPGEVKIATAGKKPIAQVKVSAKPTKKALGKKVAANGLWFLKNLCITN
jgi:hypothetical protein